MSKHIGAAAAAVLVAAALLTPRATVGDVALVNARQTVCGTTALCATDPAPDGGDQATAEQKVIDGYVKKQINCTPDLPPNPQSLSWDPPASRHTSGEPVSFTTPIHNWGASTAPTT
jgi:hypothetical protein